MSQPLRHPVDIVVAIADRRAFLRLAAGMTGAAMLSACGGGGIDAPTTTTPVATSAAAAPPVTLSTEAASLNLALNLEYLGAQFYAFASSGTGLLPSTTGGIGRAGSVGGGRKASLTDALVTQHAGELAADKLTGIVALRNQLGASAAAQPMIDFSSGPTGAFSVAAQAAGVVPAGSGFDPFSNDANFLLGAYLLENAVAAAYRGQMASVTSDAGLQVVTANLANAIYQGGVVRTLLSALATGDASLTTAYTGIATYMTKVDGTDTGDQSLADATGASANIVDADGHAIPFTRDPTQLLKLVYLNGGSATAGGFLPAGANGIA